MKKNQSHLKLLDFKKKTKKNLEMNVNVTQKTKDMRKKIGCESISKKKKLVVNDICIMDL